MQSDFDSIVEWAGSMGWKFSIQKCEVLKIGRDPVQSVSTVLGNHFCASNVINDLGILVDGRLSFDHQCRSVVRKASNVMNLIFRSSKCRDVVFLRHMFCICVLPIIDYGCVFYQPHTVKNIKLIEAMQKRVEFLCFIILLFIIRRGCKFWVWIVLR